MIPQIETNVQEVELLNVHKLMNVQPQMKNQLGFNKLNVLDQKETKTAEFQYSISGGGSYLSNSQITYGINLITQPESVNGQVIKNKFCKKRQVDNVSQFSEIKQLRQKMEKIGANSQDVERFILENMKKQGQLDDILVPGETGQKRKNEENKQKKQQM